MCVFRDDTSLISGLRNYIGFLPGVLEQGDIKSLG